MSFLSNRVQALKPSPTLALAAKAKALKDSGLDVISLSVGEPDWDTFGEIKDVGIEAIQRGQTKYTAANGLPELRKAVAEQFLRDFGVQYEASEVTVASGAKFAIFSALQAVINPGDEVLIPSPYWVSYPSMVELAQGKPVIVPCGREQSFKLSAQQLRAHIGSKTKMLILNSPSNPTGGMYSDSEWAELGQVLKDNPQALVLSDDIYNRLVFNQRGVAPHLLESCPEMKSRCISINGVSKSYSMTGWRIGWALGPQEIIQAMNNYQSQSTSCAAAFSQIAATAALERAEESVKASVQVLRQRRDFIVSELQKIAGIQVNPPEGAFYVWPQVDAFFGKRLGGKEIHDSKDFAQALLEAEKVALVPGAEFGLEGFVRISYALEQSRMAEAVERIKRFVSNRT